MRSKKPSKKKVGTFIDFLEEKIACLLWMDDVLLLSHNFEELKKMLEITHRIASKYHIEFGKDKSKLMIIGDQNIPHELKIGDMSLDVCDMYKYLGMVINKLNNLTDQIKSIKGKTEITYQTILALTGNEEMNEIEMAATWELIENTIIPIITYVSETWNPTEKEMKDLNSILDNIIRRVLITPYTTPRESLYIETGLMDPETVSKKQQILMNYKLRNSEQARNRKIAKNKESLWYQKVNKTEQELSITNFDYRGNIGTVKSKVRKKAREYLKKKIEREAANKSKVTSHLEKKQQWNIGMRSPYMNQLTRKQTSTIFKARSRMLPIKSNYKTAYITNKECRACGTEEETQQHVLQNCQELHVHTSTKVINDDIFNEEPNELRTTANKINKTMERFERISQLKEKINGTKKKPVQQTNKRKKQMKSTNPAKKRKCEANCN